MNMMADHASAICQSSYYQLRQLRCVVQSLTSDVAKTLVHAFVSCGLNYCNSLLYGVADGQLHRLQSDRNAPVRLVTGTRWLEHITPILKSLHWLPIRQRIIFKVATLAGAKLHERSCAGVPRRRLSTGLSSSNTISNCGVSRCTANVDLTRLENGQCCWAA